MDIKILSELVKLINPKAFYEFEFNGIKENKTGKDWIGTFISSKINNEGGQILIEHFKNPIIEESQPINFKQEIE